MKRVKVEEQKEMQRAAKKHQQEEDTDTPTVTSKVKPMSLRQRKAIQRGAVAYHVFNKADIITDRFIDVFQGMKYTISEFIDVNEGMKEDQVDIPIQLHKIIDLLKEKQSFDTEEKEQFKLLLYQTLKAITNIYATVDRRLASLRELNNSLDKYGKQLQQLKFMEGMSKILNSFFGALNVLEDEQYLQFKHELINREPVTEQYFTQYETEEEVPPQQEPV